MSGDDTVRRLALPLGPDEARSLNVGDLAILDGEMTVTVGMPTVKRLASRLASGEPLPIDLNGGTFMHMGICSREEGPSGRLTPLYINPTTSTRFNALMPEVIRRLRLTAVGGKGGLSRDSVEAMREVGCVYFSVVGGASALMSMAVQEIVETAWDDLIMQFRLTRIRVSGFGPVTVAIDAHGNSLYETLAASARERMPSILAALRQAGPTAEPS
jgi:fumarate hydratase subunit beta